MDIAPALVLGAVAGTVTVLVMNARRRRRGIEGEPGAKNPVAVALTVILAIGVTVLGIVLIQQR